MASENANGIAVFERDPRSGTLTQPEGAAGCIVDPANTTNTDCAVGRALQEPRAVVATWRFVYVAAGGSAAVAAFERDHASGGLEQIDGPGGCIADAGSPIDGCGTGRALARPRDLALIGRSLYAPSDRNDGVAALIRNFHTGELSQNSDESACIVDLGSPLAGCATGRALEDARGVAVSRDGRNVYVAARSSEGAAALERERRSGGLSQIEGPTGCVVDESAPVADCASGRALLQSQAIAASRDGGSVYNTGSGSNALDIFERSRRSGGIEQLAGAKGCIVDAGGPEVGGCDNTGRALADAQSVTVSPDERTVYVASFNADAIAIFDRRSHHRPWRRW